MPVRKHSYSKESVLIFAAGALLGALLVLATTNIIPTPLGSTASEDAELNNSLTAFAIGDIMVGRFVETLMERNGENYPFEKFQSVWADYDLVVGNLEGPIITNHRQTPDFTTNFSFKPETAALLKNSGIDLVSLANNHTADKGQTGFDETRQYLDAEEVGHFGDPLKVDLTANYYYEDNNQAVNWLGFHDATVTLDEPAALEAITQQKAQYPEAFQIVYIHWGTEYKLTNSARQQRMAHSFIDAGADAVIGHHPHVTQNIEVYKGKAIFYSLGNFIFDQYFSRDTQEGLGVALSLTDEQISYKLVPIDIVKSQPQLMEADKATNWLAQLAQRSDSNLAEQIQDGILTLAR